MVDLSGNDRHMNIVERAIQQLQWMVIRAKLLSISMEMINSSALTILRNDLQLWRNGGYTALGISRYTGGRSNRVISSWAKLDHGASRKC